MTCYFSDICMTCYLQIYTWHVIYRDIHDMLYTELYVHDMLYTVVYMT